MSKDALAELCHLAALRNEINTRRHRARFRKNYYAKAIRVVEAHNGSNSKTRLLKAKMDVQKIETVEDVHKYAKLQSAYDKIVLEMKHLAKKHPKPTKWQKMGLFKLRSLMLKGESDYANAKHQTMEFSIKHRAKVKELTTALGCSIRYSNGTITGIYIGAKKYNEDEINELALQHQLEQVLQE